MTAHNIVVATFSRANFLLIERATRNQGTRCVLVDLTVEAVAPLLSEDSQAVLVVDALQQEAKALDFCKIIQSQHPTVRVLILGNRADIATIARAIRAGASNVFTLHTPLDELIALLGDASANKPPSVDSVFGRAWSALPSSPDKEGVCHNRAGGRYPLHEAIKCCGSLGLSPDETAEQLKISMEMMAKIVKQSGGGTERASVAVQVDAMKFMLARRRVVATATALVIMLATATYYRISRVRGTVAVHGTVSFDGQPLERGSILFDPIESTNSRVSAVIREGKFRTELEPGLKRGESYIVRVYAYRMSSTKQEQVDGTTNVYAQEQFMPPQFNRESATQLEVTPSIVASGVVFDLR